MAPSFVSTLATAGALLAAATPAMAGFNPASGTNVAVYWGQNSYNQGTGPLAQQRLGYYCNNTQIDIIPVAFMNGITPAITNFANAGNSCTPFPDNNNVLQCPEIEADIKTCQGNGKTIMISLGGATYTQGGWGSTTDAENAAQLVWDMFGPVPSGKQVDRPFGAAVVDGFDFDFESTVSNLPAFGAKLRSLINAAGGKKFYLSAAPQCVYPDSADGATLDAVPFDWVQVQFYNNYCGVNNFKQGQQSQNAFNLDVWDQWAKGSKNPNAKVLLGIPANTGAGGGYTNGAQLKGAINWSQQYSSFGGVMMWDMSQLYANTGFLQEVVNDLGSSGTPPPPTSTPSNPPPTSTPGTPTSTPTPTSQPTSTPTPGGGTVAQWGQCGGQGYTGPTQCQAPYKCTYGGQWWSDCR